MEEKLMENGDVIELLDTLYSMISEAWGVPLGNDKCIIEREKAIEIINEIKSRVEFKEHNLLKDPYPKAYHFIVCRNVLIYFTEEAKDEIFMKFGESLCDGGIFFIGSTEQIMNHRKYGLERRNSFYYEKKDELLK